jgi:hypothetical protein
VARDGRALQAGISLGNVSPSWTGRWVLMGGIPDAGHTLDLMPNRKPGKSVRIDGLRARRSFEATAEVSQWLAPGEKGLQRD